MDMWECILVCLNDKSIYSMIFPRWGDFALNLMNSCFQNLNLDNIHLLLAQVESMVCTMPTNGHVGRCFSDAWMSIIFIGNSIRINKIAAFNPCTGAHH